MHQKDRWTGRIYEYFITFPHICSSYILPTLCKTIINTVKIALLANIHRTNEQWLHYLWWWLLYFTRSSSISWMQRSMQILHWSWKRWMNRLLRCIFHTYWRRWTSSQHLALVALIRLNILNVPTVFIFVDSKSWDTDEDWKRCRVQNLF